MTIEERDTVCTFQPIAMSINWEQRRYEIARDAMAAMIAHTPFAFTDDIVSNAVSYANALVKELKNNPV